jgi:hypothetical protein
MEADVAPVQCWRKWSVVVAQEMVGEGLLPCSRPIDRQRQEQGASSVADLQPSGLRFPFVALKVIGSMVIQPLSGQAEIHDDTYHPWRVQLHGTASCKSCHLFPPLPTSYS